MLLGIDIGGTKTSISLGKLEEKEIHIIEKLKFPTNVDPTETIKNIVNHAKKMVMDISIDKGQTVSPKIEAIGVSCGSPLDSRGGVIQSPPNLPHWHNVPICRILQEELGAPTTLQNDANACAVAEHLWGAGRGFDNLIFLTFGTGMGAGLILNGELYSGTTDTAGEVGHIRLAPSGPVGFDKLGSFEGFCSGGGIAQLSRHLYSKWISEGKHSVILSPGEKPEDITAKHVGLAAEQGDLLATKIWDMVGMRLGQALAILIDILNPQRIIIGSIYQRQEMFIRPSMMRVLEEEALSLPLAACEIVPAQLGEQIGDYAALSIAACTLR